MLKDVISGTESCIKWLEVACYDNQSKFSKNGKEHKSISKALSDHGHFSSLAHKGVENLAKDDTIEVSTLGIFGCLSRVAYRKVGVW